MAECRPATIAYDACHAEAQQEISRLREELREWRVAYAQDVADLRALLREVEWNGEAFAGERTCPVCRSVEGEGHRDTCRLAAALKGSLR